MRHSPLLLISILLSGVIALTGYGGGASTKSTTMTTSSTGQAVITISADRHFLVPASVAPGAQVKVLNQHTSTHDVTADDGGFKTRLLGQGESDTFTTPQTPGTYTIHCSRHPDMTGQLIVTGSVH